MHGFLQRVELEKYLPAFRSLGVESFADFEQVVQHLTQSEKVTEGLAVP